MLMTIQEHIVKHFSNKYKNRNEGTKQMSFKKKQKKREHNMNYLWNNRIAKSIQHFKMLYLVLYNIIKLHNYSIFIWRI